jgi:tRNA-specific 2-thiouridylase
MCFNITHPGSKKPSCCGVDGIHDAKRAAEILGILHYVLNFAQDINQKIIQNFTDEYLEGRTPNPCVQCNQHLKFGSLYEKVMSLGADCLATGHYAKIHFNQERGTFELKKGADQYKDQSYFLYSMKRSTLPRVLFPLGDITKTRVRELARKYKLNNAEKPGSQDICFIPETGYKKFLEDRLGDQVKTPGSFKDGNGNVVGQHKGIAYYTIGQRDGLGIALGRPVYVYKIEKETNTVYVGGKDKLFSAGMIARKINFVSMDPIQKEMDAQVRIRYNSPEVKARLIPIDEEHMEIRFDEPQRSVTPGQSAVFYRDDVVIGGAIIDKPLPCLKEQGALLQEL